LRFAELLQRPFSTENDQTTYCVACGQRLYKLQSRKTEDLCILAAVSGPLMTIFVVQRRC
jgi:hypothetical protein